MARNLVLCLDGTGNEPEAGATNVARMFHVARKSEEQLVFYDPGVGTLGARGAITPFGKWMTRTGGLIVGYGIKENLEEAYDFLIDNWEPGDRIYLFGFSRGAYTGSSESSMGWASPVGAGS